MTGGAVVTGGHLAIALAPLLGAPVPAPGALAPLLAAPVPAPDHWPARIALTVLTLAVFGLGGYGMRRGWRAKAACQSALLPLPDPPAEAAEPLLPPAGGVYVGTTSAGDWQARVVAGQLSDRSVGSLRLTPAGLLIERLGAPAVFVPAGAVRGARLDSALAGKVMGSPRLLVVTWEHRGQLLDTAFRADQHAAHAPYLHALCAFAASAPPAPPAASAPPAAQAPTAVPAPTSGSDQ